MVHVDQHNLTPVTHVSDKQEHRKDLNYLRREIKQLLKEREEAERDNVTTAVDDCNRRLEPLIEELQRRTGLYGRPRESGQQTKARQAVTVAIKRALQKIEKENRVVVGDTTVDFEKTEQASLESLVVEDPLVERLRHLDLDRTTPVDALVELKEMQEEAKKRKE